MNEHDGVRPQSQSSNNKFGRTDVEMMLETRIANALHHKAAHVQFTPAQRERVMWRIASHPKHALLSAPVLLFASSLVVILSFAVYLFTAATWRPLAIPTTSYIVSNSLNTPDPLANGGHLVSLDPTQRHFVYQAAQGQGVMYTADIDNPAGSNTLAMRYARDAVWAPDGSALVTTVYPKGVIEPFLALIHTGQYMDTLGHAALAASWSPTSAQEIVYVTQENGTTKLWSTTPVKGQASQLLATLPISSLVQRLVWSPDGQQLALITTTGKTPSPQLLSGPGNAIYIMDMKTHSVRALPLRASNAIGSVVFSPNGQFLTYEQVGSQTVLHTLDLAKQQELFTVTSQHTLLGWSWATDSNALVYSDGGTLAAHVLHGARINFPKTNATYPLCLADGRILTLSTNNGIGKLEILTKKTTK